MKFKALALLLSAGLALAACDADNSNDKATNPDDNHKSDVNSSETNKSKDVKENDNNVAKNSDSNDDDASADAEKDDEGSSQSDATGEEAIATKDISSTPDDIIKLLHDHNHTGDLTDISFENEDGQWVYKVAQNENDKNVEYTYSMEDRKLLNTEEDSIDKEDQTFKYEDIVPFDKMLNNAKKEVSDNAKVKEWSLETEDGVLTYAAELLDGNNEKEFKIDPQEGLVNQK